MESKTQTVRARISPAVKKKAERVLLKIGISPSEAINVFYKRIAFEQGAEDCELVRRDLQMGDATAEGLVQSIPRPTQQGGQASSLRRVDGERGAGRDFL